MHLAQGIIQKAKAVKLVLTDCDGVLTDTGVYYSADGEQLKRFSIRDGMGVERLRDICQLPTGIVTGEQSAILQRRADKLKITELHLGIKDKLACFERILAQHQLDWSQLAYIGDDYNDLEVLQRVGLSACPADAMPEIVQTVHYHCQTQGGQGAFREFAELIIRCQTTV